MYLGDYKEDDILYFCWNTISKDGASITRSTDGTISVYKDDGTTQSVAGITDTEDFDGLTGVHNCKIDLSADAFYATGHDYSIVLSAAVVDSETVNAVLATFSIENRFNEVDLVKWLGSAPAALAAGDLVQADTIKVVNATPISLAQILQQVLDGLDTLISGPTENSVNDHLVDIKTLVAALLGAGSGAIVVNHDTGGADNLAYKTGGGAGIDNAIVRAYLKSDYDAGNLDAAYVKATITTDVNGRWTKNMQLDAATYTFYFFRQPDYGPDTKEVAIS